MYEIISFSDSKRVNQDKRYNDLSGESLDNVHRKGALCAKKEETDSQIERIQAE
jgi:hypothetical protein